MNPPTITTNEEKQLLEAQAHIWNHIFAYLNSMAIKCALELGIPDAIQKEGKPLSLTSLIHSLAIHPSKASSFHRLMRLLCHSNFFSSNYINGEPIFNLTTNSELLLKNHPLSMASFATLILEPIMTNPACYFSLWFKNDEESPFHVAHGRSIWEHLSHIKSFDECFNKGMAQDGPFVASLILKSYESKSLLFQGIKSLVDVGGGDGTMAKAIAKAYPGLKCMVLDLPHVVHGVKESDVENVVYVGGNMFEAIPRANAVLLKWILHDWSDEECIKILKRCREAIPSKEQGGKVIIIDIVMECKNTNINYLTSQYLFDMEMMSVTIGGKERNEQEWKKLFMQAGFSDYKILSLLGPRSVIVVYPF